MAFVFPDSFILSIDRALRTLCLPVSKSAVVPGADLRESRLSKEEVWHAGALMRINHVGEVCAQALYQGQSLACSNALVRDSLAQAADEELEHLAWTARRIEELGSRVSFLNPFWYLGAGALGVIAGKCGDGWSLGFLAETERQVGAHLESHLRFLPEGDLKSRTIVRQMRDDELRHAEMAMALGALVLPSSVQSAMRVAAKLMTRVAYYI